MGYPYAVNPDAELRRTATERGWPIMVFAKPVAMRSTIANRANAARAGAAIGGAVALGLAWYAAQRGRR